MWILVADDQGRLQQRVRRVGFLKSVPKESKINSLQIMYRYIGIKEALVISKGGISKERAGTDESGLSQGHANAQDAIHQ